MKWVFMSEEMMSACPHRKNRATSPIYTQNTRTVDKKTRGQMIVGSVFEVQGVATVSRYLLEWVGRSRRMRQEQTPTANMALFEVTRRRTRKPG